MITVTLGSETREPTSFRIEGEGDAYLALIAAAASADQVSVRVRKGSRAESELRRRLPDTWVNIDG